MGREHPERYSLFFAIPEMKGERMNTKIITLACAMSAEEYQRFKAICEQNSTYPSAAIREAVMEWMEKNSG